MCLAGLLEFAPPQPRPFRIRAKDRAIWEALPADARLYAARVAARHGFVLDEAIKGMHAGIDALGRAGEGSDER